MSVVANFYSGKRSGTREPSRYRSRFGLLSGAAGDHGCFGQVEGHYALIDADVVE